MTSFEWLVLGWVLLALIIFPINLKIKAPYGRHTNNKWGPTINNKLGWVIMELPAMTLVPLMAVTGPLEKSPALYLFIGLWLIHYIHRTLVFPFQTKTGEKQIPISIVLMAIIFNGGNGALNGYYFGHVQPYSVDWLLSSQFIIGSIIFFIGMGINIFSDYSLIKLRSENAEYKIPKGGVFNLISCPNHLGEIVEWFGFAILTGSPAALSFAIWTVANLVPRSLAHHKWYKSKFSNYPKNRKAIIPLVL